MYLCPSGDGVLSMQGSHGESRRAAGLEAALATPASGAAGAAVIVLGLTGWIVT